MSWNDGLPKSVENAVQHEVVKLSEKCKPCWLIVHRVITKKRIMDHYWLSSNSMESMQSLAKYMYYKGALDFSRMGEKEREVLVNKAAPKVIEYEAEMKKHIK